MIASANPAYPFLDRLRKGLPTSARAKQPLLGYLQSKRVIGSTSPTLRIVNVFLNGYGNIMCQFAIEGDARAHMFVAPLTQLALNRRRHPAAREAAKAINPFGRRLGAVARV